jgi:hypothetical protein
MLPTASIRDEEVERPMRAEPVDFHESRIEDADFTPARLHAPSFEEAKITDGWFYNADISATLQGCA